MQLPSKQRRKIPRGAGPRDPTKATHSGAPSLALVATTLGADDEKIAAQYRKMQKFGLPEDAVRHKMSVDGIATHIIEAVIASGSLPARPAPAPAPPSRRQANKAPPKVSKLCPKEEKIATKYRKIVKLGLTEGGIRHKMAADGVPAKIADSVIAGEVAPGGAASPPGPAATSTRAPPKKAQKKISSLSPQEEAIATQYRKMVKLGLPEGAVRHKMAADGVSNKIAESVINGEVPSSKAGSGGAAPRGTQQPSIVISASLSTAKERAQSMKAARRQRRPPTASASVPAPSPLTEEVQAAVPPPAHTRTKARAQLAKSTHAPSPSPARAPAPAQARGVPTPPTDYVDEANPVAIVPSPSRKQKKQIILLEPLTFKPKNEFVAKTASSTKQQHPILLEPQLKPKPEFLLKKEELAAKREERLATARKEEEKDNGEPEEPEEEFYRAQREPRRHRQRHRKRNGTKAGASDDDGADHHCNCSVM